MRSRLCSDFLSNCVFNYSSSKKRLASLFLLTQSNCPFGTSRIRHDSTIPPHIDDLTAEEEFYSGQNVNVLTNSDNISGTIPPERTDGGGEGQGLGVNGVGRAGEDCENRHPSSNFSERDVFIGDNESAFESEDPSIDEGLMRSIDALCDDLFNCRPDVLRQFARARGITSGSKAQCVAKLVDKAFEEALSVGELKYTRKVLGEEALDKDVSLTGIRRKWTDKTLEASFLESACERQLKFMEMSSKNNALLARRNFKKGEAVMRALIRPFLEDFSNICEQATQGVHFAYKEEVNDLLRSTSMVNVLSPFGTYLVGQVTSASSSAFIGQTDAIQRLTDLGLYRPVVDDDKVLDVMMGMLDVVSDDASKCFSIWEHIPSQFGTHNQHTMISCTQSFLDSNSRYWELDEVPSWVSDMATKFGNWEVIARNDIKMLESAPSIVFLTILQGVATYRITKMIYGDNFTQKDIHPSIKNSVKQSLLMHYQDEDKAAEATHQLQQFAGVVARDPRSISFDFFVAVDAQLQSSVQDLNSTDKTERIAIILRQISYIASQAERCSGLYWLLLKLTIDMQFHLRFLKIYERLSPRDRLYVKEKNRSLAPMLLFFERDMNVIPLSSKAACFLCIILLSMTFKPSSSGQPPKLRRYASVSGKDEFSLIEFTDKDRAIATEDLKIALPPQLSYQSWLERDDKKSSVYENLRSDAVKGSTNNIMLLSQAPVIKALDVISKVPWRISRYMLYVQEAIIQEGYGFGKIRPSFYPLHYTSKKTGEILHDGMNRSIFNIELTREYKKQRDIDWRRITELRSSRIHYLQAMRQARALIQYSHLYFPNSLDFRGRMYPLPGRLNHTGSDPFRALLEYAEPKPLGKEGVYWLKVHLANKMGMTKLTFDERVKYVDEHINDVVNSAEAPLTGDRWWQEGSEPLQALMAIHELSEAVKYSQGAENYPSHIPVAVDGSYNGLQHYSAIGRDEYGAELVNLKPSERPADAYTGILKEMLKSIEKDARNNMQVAMRCIGSGVGLDKNHIKRKTIKRPIMTQVYGVTSFGMREQIFEELYRQNFQHGLWTRVDVKEMAGYICEKVLESLGVTFKETQECRKWLDIVTALIWRCQPKDLRNVFSWTTPLGLIVRQPYRLHKESHLFTMSGYSRVSGQTLAPASRKQLSAIAPNLIHSLDATHLAMTAIEMNSRGLEMMAVHDSFWTHACDLPVMSRILREQFVTLYDNYDPLYELKEQWEELFFFDLRRHGMKLPDPPPRGTLDLKSVLNSPYFFS